MLNRNEIHQVVIATFSKQGFISQNFVKTISDRIFEQVSKMSLSIEEIEKKFEDLKLDKCFSNEKKYCFNINTNKFSVLKQDINTYNEIVGLSEKLFVMKLNNDRVLKSDTRENLVKYVPKTITESVKGCKDEKILFDTVTDENEITDEQRQGILQILKSYNNN
jgi:hypothetical protein